MPFLFFSGQTHFVSPGNLSVCPTSSPTLLFLFLLLNSFLLKKIIREGKKRKPAQLGLSDPTQVGLL